MSTGIRFRDFMCMLALLLAGPFLASAQERAGFAAMVSSGSTASPGIRHPNIIFLLTDDQRWDALGAMGNPIIQTPNLDALAGRGILFRNAYVTTSICCCSRASILTGQYMARHKINDFSTNLDSAATAATYPLLLKKQGYVIGFIDKYGVGDHPPSQLYDYWSCTEKGQPDYLLPRANGDTLHNTDSAGHDIQKFLNLYAGKAPFCLSVSFKAPHEQDAEGSRPSSLIVQNRFRDLYTNVAIPVPLTADSIYWNRLPDFMRTPQNIGRERWQTYFSTPALYQRTVKNYYRLITGVDEVVGQLVQQLQQAGIADNTIIIFMGDNGMFLGEHGMQGKWYGYEESIRVPLIVYDPRQAAHGIQASQIALNIDIAPTILSLTGFPVPAAMQGSNLVAIATKKTPERKDFYYEHHFLHSPQIPQTEGVVGTGMKYLFYPEHHYEELFDLKKDPHETTNLAGDPHYTKTLEHMRLRYQELKKKAY